MLDIVNSEIFDGVHFNVTDDFTCTVSVGSTFFFAGEGLGSRYNYYTIQESSGFKSLSKYFEVTFKKKFNSYKYFSL